MGEGERLPSLGCFFGIPLVPLKNGLGDGSKEGQELQVVRAKELRAKD
jgi:hypothetical protein